ncbi:hypothetical protein QBC38DRAFT_535256 [Podospora fimiseda]|uniref:Glycosyltransferase Family 31 n=1 Tax=Podospora fimiseda TaxID=252190 RepID=A0AAN7BTI0_9PEZI|nr:hypothetical protein QBC38DRAFT_535256 [Podospora fimiseda]
MTIRVFCQPSLSLTDTFKFTRKCIKPIITPDLPRESITNISSPFFTHSSQTEISFSTCHSSSIPPLPPCDPLPLPVPPPYPQEEYPHLLFGVASTYDRVQSSLPAFKHWLSGTSARIIIIISDFSSLPPKNNLLDLEKLYRKSGIQATVLKPKPEHGYPRQDETEEEQKRREERPTSVEELHFLLVGILSQYMNHQTEWIGIIDDDTFFPSLYTLSTALSQYDHRKPVWLGALANNWHSLSLYGHQAYGGAGVFLSPPLMSSLTPHLPQCIFSSPSKTGDSLLRDCIISLTSTKLTLLPGLNQLDLRTDASGFFESSPSPLLSLHHWKSWFKSPVVQISSVTNLCGDCLLRRYKFSDETIWTNGFSVNKYKSSVLREIDFDKVEGTWERAEKEKGMFEAAYGGLRRKLKEDERKRWKLVDARFEEGKGKKGDEGRRLFRQVYVWYDKERGGKGKDGVVVVEWEV